MIYIRIYDSKSKDKKKNVVQYVKKNILYNSLYSDIQKLNEQAIAWLARSFLISLSSLSVCLSRMSRSSCTKFSIYVLHCGLTSVSMCLLMCLSLCFSLSLFISISMHLTRYISMTRDLL